MNRLKKERWNKSRGPGVAVTRQMLSDCGTNLRGISLQEFNAKVNEDVELYYAQCQAQRVEKDRLERAPKYQCLTSAEGRKVAKRRMQQAGAWAQKLDKALGESTAPSLALVAKLKNDLVNIQNLKHALVRIQELAPSVVDEILEETKLPRKGAAAKVSHRDAVTVLVQGLALTLRDSLALNPTAEGNSLSYSGMRVSLGSGGRLISSALDSGVRVHVSGRSSDAGLEISIGPAPRQISACFPRRDIARCGHPNGKLEIA